MLQYLLNATAIWLISLISYDVFLKKESYHNYNRFFLLFTFLLGVLLPLCQWQRGSIYTPALQRPLEQIISVKEHIVRAGAAADVPGWQHWLYIIYLAGAAAAFVMLIIDVVKLSSFYRNGVKSVNGRWRVVETGKDHAPFSFLNTLFVAAIANYDDDEWAMILVHEQRHASLLHIADLLLMQTARIIFWFHPLVYLYNSRLLLVHEYQADTASAGRAQVYGRFLIEQALLQTAPSVSHSFNRSPIKKRIIMLTRTSSAAARTKMLVFMPLALVCTLCCSKNGFSQKFERNGNLVTYRGNTFELSEPKKDTIELTDPVTGKIRTELSQSQPVPVKMNGTPIPEHVDKPPYFKGSDDDLQTYILKQIKDQLTRLGDGTYYFYISDFVVDESGKVVYFNYGGIYGNAFSNPGTGEKKNISFGANAPAEFKGQNFTVHKAGPQINIDKNVGQDIFEKVCRVMNRNDLFVPATQNGHKVTTVDNALMSSSGFTVRDHKVYKRRNYQEIPLN